MKICIILAALLLAAPAASFAGHRPHVVVTGRCYSRPHWGYAPYYAPYGWYAPGPVLGISYVSSAPVYEAVRYYEPSGVSLETDVQRALGRRGYYAGPLDGDLGPRSRAAIREFQADHGLAVSGRVDGSLLRALGI